MPPDPPSLLGLSSAEAAGRLQRDGANDLPSAKPRRLIAIAWQVVREPMFLLLLACSALYLVLGDLREALMLLGFVVVVLGITLVQERKTERALEALRDLSQPTATVIRDGARRGIPSRELVAGDLIFIAEGDRVPADAAIVDGSDLAADESLLSGESIPVRKAIWDGVRAPGRPGGDDLPFVFSGTLLVRGQGLAQVLNTGERSAIGAIGRALVSVQVADTGLQREVGRVVRRVAVVAALLCAAVVVAFALTRGDWIGGLLAGITLAMAMIPEEFPVVLTIFLAMGAWRLSKERVLTRRMATVEALGAATVLCVDKTGTLTVNRMAVARLAVDGQTVDVADGQPLPEAVHALVEFGILASQRDPFDPMEQAFHRLGGQALADTEHLHGDWTHVREYPLSRELLALSHVWRSPAGTDYVLAAKGAPEAIIDLCHFDPARSRLIAERAAAMAEDGLRVLGVAKGVFRSRNLPAQQHDFDFTFLGLVGLADPIRPTVPAAIRECRHAGIRVVMITGDHPRTAASIAGAIGLDHPDQVIAGAELAGMDEQALRTRIRDVNVFARMVPEQKLRLVKALKAAGEVVAMTGDGVNDAPALKAADIGIAMGGRGTEVAREAAGLVLLDDEFPSIVRAIRMGRSIFARLRKAMVYIIAIHIPIAGMSLLPVLCGWPLVLLPVHVLALELVIDPTCSIVFEQEPADPDVMDHPPRDPRGALFNRGLFGLGLVQGGCVLAAVLGVFLLAWLGSHDEPAARAAAFITLMVGNLGLILVNRSWTRSAWSMLDVRNRAAWWVIGGGVAALGLVLALPPLRAVFHFSLPSVTLVGWSVAAGGASVLWFEAFKVLRGRSARAAPDQAATREEAIKDI